MCAPSSIILVQYSDKFMLNIFIVLGTGHKVQGGGGVGWKHSFNEG